MPTQRSKQKKWLVIAAAVLLTATPSFALFGIGDVVFDPDQLRQPDSTTDHAPDAVQHGQK